MLAQILALTTLGSLGSLLGAGILMAFPRLCDRLLVPMVGFATAMLLGSALTDLLPDALARAPAGPVLLTVLAGLLGLLAIERALEMRGHHPDGPVPTIPASAAVTVMIGDTLHNFVDGVLVAGLGLIAALHRLVPG